MLKNHERSRVNWLDDEQSDRIRIFFWEDEERSPFIGNLEFGYQVTADIVYNPTHPNELENRASTAELL